MNEINFKKTLKRLEKILKELKSGRLSLENSLKKYEEGIKLIQVCSKKLDEVRKKLAV